MHYFIDQSNNFKATNTFSAADKLVDLFYDVENPSVIDALQNTEFHHSCTDADNQTILLCDSISETDLITELYFHKF
jgi:hypothetical protein